MKKAMSLLLVLVMSAPLAGCIVHTGPRQSSRSSYARSCPPAHHWEGGACVHNGRARGHYK
jgi:Flp pilus assembly protein TadD